jgi:hypothetical protein
MMGKSKISLIKTVVFSLLVLLSASLTMLTCHGSIIENSWSEKENNEKIYRGLNLALEAIRIAGYDTTEGNAGSINSLKADGRFTENTNSKIGDNWLTKGKTKHYRVKIPANRPWKKTRVHLKKNDIVRIYCKGKVMPGSFEQQYNNTSCYADGYAFSRGNYTVLPNNNYMAVIGKIGKRDTFYIGGRKEFISYVNGPLRLGINDLNKSVYTGEPLNKKSIYWKDNSGYFEADIYVYRK